MGAVVVDPQLLPCNRCMRSIYISRNAMCLVHSCGQSDLHEDVGLACF